MSHAKIDHYFRTNLLNPGFTDSIEDLLDDILESCSTEEIYGYYNRYKSPTYKGVCQGG